ncbi:efflux RND transporter periplasmic adaptor subunit [bacterium]|nr:efflux RND transporter periplasmic adaptor subunit [bacterium]
MKKIIIITILVLFAAIALRAITYTVQGFMMANKMKKANVPGVTIEEINTRSVVKKFEAPGRIQSVSRIDVVARISGYLTKSYFKEGDIVKKGQVLFEIEPQEYQLAADKAKANLDNSIAQLKYYEKQLIRAKELVKLDYISKSQYDQTLAQRDSYKAQVNLNRSAYQDALRNLSYTKVKAPVDGQIGMLNISVGNFVTAQSGALTTINSVDPIYVSFPLDAKNYTELLRIDKVAEVSRNVDLYFSTGSKYAYQGVQNFHDNKVDATTGTIMMRATFPNPKGLLLNGNYSTVYIYSKEKEDVPVVPQIAVMENPQYKYVYKIDAKGLPQIQPIETFGQDGKDWIVKSGLKKGDKVVVLGIQGVIPSKPVRELSEEEIKAIDRQAAEKVADENEKESDELLKNEK